MRKQILSHLEKNCRLTPAELAAMLGSTEEEVSAEIHAMEDEKIICGYHAMIDWDKADSDWVTAMIGVKISPVRGEGFDRISKRISKFDEVQDVYLMSGSSWDLLLTIECATMKEISHFVYEKLAPMESVVSTATYFVLKKYKDHNVILGEDRSAADDRIPVMP